MYVETREIILNGRKIPYSLRFSNRAKRISLNISGGNNLTAVLPKHLGEKSVERFIKEKEKWVLHHTSLRQKTFGVTLPKHKKSEYKILKEHAREFVELKLVKFNEYYSLNFNSVNIKNYKSQWGSCSNKNNLNFTYKLIFLPEKLAEYVVVHELCHLKEFNHSPRFWELVAETIPDYKTYERRLKKYYLV